MMRDFRRGVRARLSAVGSAVGVLALMTLVLLVTRGHNRNPLTGAAGSPSAPATGTVVGSVSAAPASTAAPGSTAPIPSPSETAPAPADLRRLLAHVPCPPLPLKRLEIAKYQLVRFHPVAALRCEIAPATLGGTRAVPIRTATADVDPIIAALERADARREPGTMCPMYVWAGPTLVLVDASGHTLVPQYPTDSCGHPQQAVLRLLQGSGWKQLPAASAR
jgi:hypothetical protein